MDWRDVYDEMELAKKCAEHSILSAEAGNYDTANVLNAAADAIEELADDYQVLLDSFNYGIDRG